MRVADLKLHGSDALGDRVLAVFACKAPHYAVYGACRRVAVQYSDSSHEADQQRKAMAAMGPLRGEIDGLIDGWRTGSSHSFFGLENGAVLRSKADRYERRVGDALVVALEGDVSNAMATLGAIKQDILNERTSWARFEYLVAAFAMAMTVMFVAFLIASTYPVGREGRTVTHGGVAAAVLLLLFALAAGAAAYFAGNDEAAVRAAADRKGGAVPSPAERHLPHWVTGFLLFVLFTIPIVGVFITPSFSHADDLSRYATPINAWRAAAAGAVGAFFSIAVGIRTRTVLPDLLRTSNIMDAALRVTIGFIAGAVLFAMMKLGIVNVQIGDLAKGGSKFSELRVILIGFFAGFSERLVPDLLEKAKTSIGGSFPQYTGPPPPSPPAPPPPPPAAPGDAAGDAAPAAEGEGEAALPAEGEAEDAPDAAGGNGGAQAPELPAAADAAPAADGEPQPPDETAP